MKKMCRVALFAGALVIIAGIAIAGELRGNVSAVNSKTGDFTVNSEGKEVDFESKAGILPKNLGVKDTVIIKFDEVKGKKTATKIRKVPIGC